MLLVNFNSQWLNEDTRYANVWSFFNMRFVFIFTRFQFFEVFFYSIEFLFLRVSQNFQWKNRFKSKFGEFSQFLFVLMKNYFHSSSSPLVCLFTFFLFRFWCITFEQNFLSFHHFCLLRRLNRLTLSRLPLNRWKFCNSDCRFMFSDLKIFNNIFIWTKKRISFKFFLKYF